MYKRQDYYTGTVYETTLLDHPEIGSVCSGGRYDNLAGYYTDRQLPGVGISIGLTRLFYVLGEQSLCLLYTSFCKFVHPRFHSDSLQQLLVRHA